MNCTNSHPVQGCYLHSINPQCKLGEIYTGNTETDLSQHNCTNPRLYM